MSQVKKQPIVQDVQESAKRQVSEVVRVGEDAVTSGAWMYPIQVSLGRNMVVFRDLRLTPESSFRCHDRGSSIPSPVSIQPAITSMLWTTAKRKLIVISFLYLCRPKPDEASLPRHSSSRSHLGRSLGGHVHLHVPASGRRVGLRYRTSG
jgi:hypothetical protein